MICRKRLRKVKKFIYLAIVVVVLYQFDNLIKWTDDIHYSEVVRSRQRIEQQRESNGILTLDFEFSIDDTFTKEGYPVRSVHGREVDKHDTDYSEVTLPSFVEKADQGSPGEGGKPFRFRDADLTLQQKQEKLKAFRTHRFDVAVSDVISVHRTVPDLRSEKCLNASYITYVRSSVIIVFHNEAWSTLLRTIFSVLDRTQPYNILEIVLVDDASTMEHLKLPLEKYMKSLSKVRLIRTTRRIGLIQGRNLGSLYAKGSNLIFMDPHVECLPGWYEPLVSPLQNNDKIITFPVVDVIDPNSFAVLEQSSMTLIGSVHLHSLLFTWLEGRGHSHETTIKSSTMPGSVLAISKKWFLHLGMFDPYLQVWGGENIEMSFKAWMCGGGIFITTCSHVAHLPRTPVNVKSHTALLNSARVAEVWMDEYKQYFYEKTAFLLAGFNHTNIDSRKELRQSLRCKNFQWYLTNVSPDLHSQIDEYSFYLGQIKNKLYSVCLDSKHNYVRPEVIECSSSFSQVWLLRTDGRLTSHGSMLIAQPGTDENDLRLTTVPLNISWKYDDDLNHQWEYDKLDRLVHKKSRLCLGVRNMARLTLDLTHCTTKMMELRWQFKSRKDFYRQHNQTLITSVVFDDDL